jgi:Na+-translocating ferredoxin:NAD+ oxidoreductase RnfD subunit
MFAILLANMFAPITDLLIKQRQAAPAPAAAPPPGGTP